MRPILMIDDLKTLHDARYCAAVGIGMVSFDMRSGGMAPLTVREIAEWLSGVTCFGRLDVQDPGQIASIMEQAGLAGVILPLDYPVDWAAGLEGTVVYDGTAPTPDCLTLLKPISERLPGALFLVPGQLLSHAHNLEASLVARMIVVSEEPDAIFHHLKSQGRLPHGFCLGAFAIDDAGQVDYDACDSFISSYETLVPA